MSNLAVINHEPESQFHAGQYQQLITYYDETYRTGWFLMNSAPRPCVTHTLLVEISDYLDQVKSDMRTTQGEKYEFLVFGSNTPGIYSLGGDLNKFVEYFESGNREKLLQYAIHCVDIQYQNMVHYEEEMTSISLVQGDALGGGFEAALSCNVIVAEKGVKMGLPEVLFNLFPGMGAYTMLSRKIGGKLAERMIFSGKLYSAEELHDMGVVDILAPQGEGELAVYDYIKNANRIRNTHQAMRKVRDRCDRVDYQELVDITRIWVDSVFRLEEKDLRMMKRLVKRQNAKIGLG